MSNDSLTEANFFTTDEVYKLAALVNESLESVLKCLIGFHYTL
jgi:hypothetical protein